MPFPRSSIYGNLAMQLLEYMIFDTDKLHWAAHESGFFWRDAKVAVYSEDAAPPADTPAEDNMVSCG